MLKTSAVDETRVGEGSGGIGMLSQMVRKL